MIIKVGHIDQCLNRCIFSWCVHGTGALFQISKGVKSIAEMHLGLLTSKEILVSLAILLFWASFILWNIKEENIFKLN